MNIGAIRTALAGCLSTVYSNDWHVLADDPTVDVAAPEVRVLSPADVRYGVSLGLDSVTVPVRVVVSQGDDVAALDLLDLMLSTGIDGSLVDALRSSGSHLWRGAPQVALGVPVDDETIAQAGLRAFDLAVTFLAPST